jgi:hypothetical protein
LNHKTVSGTMLRQWASGAAFGAFVRTIYSDHNGHLWRSRTCNVERGCGQIGTRSQVKRGGLFRRGAGVAAPGGIDAPRFLIGPRIAARLVGMPEWMPVAKEL